jgi:hypothetical protein
MRFKSSVLFFFNVRPTRSMPELHRGTYTELPGKTAYRLHPFRHVKN